MAKIFKNIPQDVEKKKSLGFRRPQEDIIDCAYEARVVKSTKNPGLHIVFFEFKHEKKKITWGINAADLLGLDANPVDEKNNRLVQDDGWVGTVPSDIRIEPSFHKVN